MAYGGLAIHTYLAKGYHEKLVYSLLPSACKMHIPLLGEEGAIPGLNARIEVTGLVYVGHGAERDSTWRPRRVFSISSTDDVIFGRSPRTTGNEAGHGLLFWSKMHREISLMFCEIHLFHFLPILSFFSFGSIIC